MKTLVTGATGYLGKRIAKTLVDKTDDSLLLWINASNQEEFERKSSQLREELGGGTRLEFQAGSLRADAPFESLDSKEIQKVIHCAAVTAFNVDEATALAVNIHGTEKLLKFASTCARLEKFTHLSTAYASGMAFGKIEEDFLSSDAGFANHYERSKWVTEGYFQREYSGLPWQILRVATAIADGKNGKVIQQNAVHNTLKLFYYGLISLIPGNPETPIYLVTGDFVAEAVLQAVKGLKTHKIYNVCHGEVESIRLGEMIDIAFTTFNEDPSFKSRRLLRPLFTDLDSFNKLVEGATAFSTGVLGQAVGSIAPFGRQLFIHKQFMNDHLRTDWPGYFCEDIRELLRETCRYLSQSKFGRNALS